MPSPPQDWTQPLVLLIAAIFFAGVLRRAAAALRAQGSGSPPRRGR